MATEDTLFDLLVIGAGPSGIHAACTALDLGLSVHVVDRFGLAHSFVEYPQAIRFFSPPDEMEVGGVPFPMRGGEKPSREDILPYFRAVAAYRKLSLSLWETIVSFEKTSDLFKIKTVTNPPTAINSYYARNVILATGVWDVPNRIGCPGDDLPHVRYRFTEPTEYFGQTVLVVGGGNSAVHAALSLSEAHARVTLAMRRVPLAGQSHLRPFVVRDLQFAVDDKKVDLRAGVSIHRIEPGIAWLQPFEYDANHPTSGTLSREPYKVDARFVFAMTGQKPDNTLFTMIGLSVDPNGRPIRNDETYETEVSGVFVVGSLAGQKIDIIIAGREQAAMVVQNLARRLRETG